MDKEGAYITLSEGVYQVAAATEEWPEFANAKSAVLQAALDGKLTIYGVPRFLHQPEAIPAHAFAKPLLLPSLELLSLVKNPKPTRFGDWGSGAIRRQARNSMAPSVHLKSTDESVFGGHGIGADRPNHHSNADNRRSSQSDSAYYIGVR
jgi:hypothetical protein